MPSISVGLLPDVLVITRDALIRNSLETHKQLLLTAHCLYRLTGIIALSASSPAGVMQ